MTIGPHPICYGCSYFHDDGSITCKAFPDRIPDDIFFESSFDHRKSHEGDHGIQFDPKSPADAEYAKELFEGTE